jgi:hypothetical protein
MLPPCLTTTATVCQYPKQLQDSTNWELRASLGWLHSSCRCTNYFSPYTSGEGGSSSISADRPSRETAMWYKPPRQMGLSEQSVRYRLSVGKDLYLHSLQYQPALEEPCLPKLEEQEGRCRNWEALHMPEIWLPIADQCRQGGTTWFVSSWHDHFTVALTGDAGDGRSIVG